jgi:hypothetical protein
LCQHLCTEGGIEGEQVAYLTNAARIANCLLALMQLLSPPDKQTLRSLLNHFRQPDGVKQSIDTDPTGYFTMGEIMGGLQSFAILAGMSGVSFGTGYIAGAAASGEEILPLFGEWGAGFASGVSGGFLTDVYEAASGNKIQPKHAMLYQSGVVSGISVSFLLGMKAPGWAMTEVGPLKWTATAILGLDVYGAVRATGNLVNSYRDNGAWEREDAWNLLSYVPFLGAIKGVNYPPLIVSPDGSQYSGGL